ALPNPTRAKTQRVQNPNPRFITTPPSLDVDPVPTHRAVCRPIFFNRIRDKKQTHELPGSGSISLPRLSIRPGPHPCPALGQPQGVTPTNLSETDPLPTAERFHGARAGLTAFCA